jgi:hypothetical protein
MHAYGITAEPSLSSVTRLGDSVLQWAPKVLQCFAVSDCLQCGALWNETHASHYREKVGYSFLAF